MTPPVGVEALRPIPGALAEWRVSTPAGRVTLRHRGDRIELVPGPAVIALPPNDLPGFLALLHEAGVDMAGIAAEPGPDTQLSLLEATA